MVVLEGVNKLADRLPELIDVFVGLGQVVREIHFVLFAFAQLVDRQLEAVVVLVQQAFDFDEVVLIERVEYVLHVVPDLGFDLAGSIRES